jgi:hypothetical protein
MAGTTRKTQRTLSHRGGGTRGRVRTTVELDKLLAFLGLSPPRVIRGPPQRWVWPVLLDLLSYFCVFLVGNDASRTWRAWYEWEKMVFLGRSWGVRPKKAITDYQNITRARGGDS